MNTPTATLIDFDADFEKVFRSLNFENQTQKMGNVMVRTFYGPNAEYEQLSRGRRRLILQGEDGLYTITAYSPMEFYIAGPDKKCGISLKRKKQRWIQKVHEGVSHYLKR